MKVSRGALGASLASIALAFGCVSETDANNDEGSSLDGGFDASKTDARSTSESDARVEAQDARSNDAQAASDSSAALTTCRSWIEPTAGMCGGAHCNQNFADLRASAQAGATCGSEADLMTLCSLRGPNAVAQCTQQTAANRAATASCAQTALGSAVSAGCLECYMRSFDCALTHCVADCLSGANTVRCDDCRVRNGCAEAFFTCAGLAVPPQKQ